MRRCGHDDEGDDSDIGAKLLQAIIDTGQRFDEHVDALVPVLVASGSEEVEGVVEVEVVMPVEVSADKVIDLLLRKGMQILELMHGRELDDVEAIRQNAVRFPLEQVLTFVGGDVADGGENIGAMCGCALDAVAMVDTSLAGLVIDVKVGQVVVKVDTACTEISAEKGSVRGEDGRDVNLPLSA